MTLNWLDRNLICGPHLTLCVNEKEFEEVIKHLGIEEPQRFILNPQSNATTHFFLKEDKDCNVVCIRVEKDIELEQVYSLLIHEAVHIWQSFCERIGEIEPSSEFEAYSIQTISQQLMFEYKRKLTEKEVQ